MPSRSLFIASICLLSLLPACFGGRHPALFDQLNQDHLPEALSTLDHILVLRLPTEPLSQQRVKGLLQDFEEGLPTLSQKISFIDGIDWRDFNGTSELLQSEAAEKLFSKEYTDSASVLNVAKDFLFGSASQVLSSGEIACWLGHIKAWEWVAQNVSAGHMAMILEDDVIFGAHSLGNLESLHVPAAGEKPPLVFLSAYQCPHGAGSDVIGSAMWWNLFFGRGGYGALAYAIAPETARAMLSSISMRHPVDIWMQFPFLAVQRICPLVTPFSQRPSDHSEINHGSALRISPDPVEIVVTCKNLVFLGIVVLAFISAFCQIVRMHLCLPQGKGLLANSGSK